MSEEGPKLLVVDDIEDNRYTLIRRLKRQGYDNVVEAENGRQALERLREGAFDLVLLDIMMPEMDGYETLETVKSDPALRDIPVIMISAIDEMESVVKCIELGAEDYLPKPFNRTLLRARVGASLEKKKLHDQETFYLQQIETEKRRADDLLNAVFPPGAVRELKETNEVKPRRYENVAVLFCDVVAFTSYCDKNAPEQVVAELQDLTHAFEEITEKEGLEKIKTIGDAFLATGGLLQHLDEPILGAVRCGHQMVAAAQTLEPFWEVRVGIHFGPVVAGILGRRQFLFDLWGDTVNTAARIAEYAPASSVVLSNDGWYQIRNHFNGKSHGHVTLKGKGKVELIEALETKAD